MIAMESLAEPILRTKLDPNYIEKFRIFQEFAIIFQKLYKILATLENFSNGANLQVFIEASRGTASEYHRFVRKCQNFNMKKLSRLISWKFISESSIDEKIWETRSAEKILMRTQLLPSESHYLILSALSQFPLSSGIVKGLSGCILSSPFPHIHIHVWFHLQTFFY